MIFKELINVLEHVKSTYDNEFRAMVFGSNFPASEKILETLRAIRERLSKIKWTVMVPEKMRN